MKRAVRHLSVVCAIILIVLSIMVCQKKLTSLKGCEWTRENMSYLPRSERIKPYLLGFSSTVANYLWIKTVLYFGTHYETDRDFPWLITMIDIVTTLNPYFYPAYEFAGVIIPQFTSNLDAARIILNRGITHLGNKRFSIPFYLAWIYHEKYGDRKTAAEYLIYASKNKNAPEFYTSLAASLLSKAGEKELALKFLVSAYHSSENPAVRKTVEEKIRVLNQ